LPSCIAHDKLKKLKIGKESFSELLTRELPDRANTCGEVLEKLEGKELPPMDPNLLKAVRNGRGRPAICLPTSRS